MTHISVSCFTYRINTHYYTILFRALLFLLYMLFGYNVSPQLTYPSSIMRELGRNDMHGDSELGKRQFCRDNVTVL